MLLADQFIFSQNTGPLISRQRTDWYDSDQRKLLIRRASVLNEFATSHQRVSTQLLLGFCARRFRESTMVCKVGLWLDENAGHRVARVRGAAA